MAFSTLRGRPKARAPEHDPGTPELRLKHALGLTCEPIDLCLSKDLISKEQHWCALHLRWLYTVRYGAPVTTTRYGDRETAAPGASEDDPTWREMREREYHAAIAELQKFRRHEPVMRVAVFNELPAFLSRELQHRAFEDRVLAQELLHTHHKLSEGLEILAQHWRHAKPTAKHR